MTIKFMFNFGYPISIQSFYIPTVFPDTPEVSISLFLYDHLPPPTNATPSSTPMLEAQTSLGADSARR
ncbi:hypothetical protein L1887_05563 [Cichorium endivia]|nr:hypothetical protein L1887_05563 [Cichorium endivia]